MSCYECGDSGEYIEKHWGVRFRYYCSCVEGQRLKEFHEGQREQVIDAKRKGEDNRYDPRVEGERR